MWDSLTLEENYSNAERLPRVKTETIVSLAQACEKLVQQDSKLEGVFNEDTVEDMGALTLVTQQRAYVKDLKQVLSRMKEEAERNADNARQFLRKQYVQIPLHVSMLMYCA